MRSSLCRSSLLLGLLLACSSADRESDPKTAVESKPEATATATDEPKGPVVGAPAPALALASLSGERVQLPVADSKRASVLMFGSFS
jgi:hypothetical protein